MRVGLMNLLALQLALVVLLVTAIHFIEAYGLNPAIYSAHLKLHPLLVLTVLVVAEHSLGVWGLLLAGGAHFLPLRSLHLTCFSIWHHRHHVLLPTEL